MTTKGSHHTPAMGLARCYLQDNCHIKLPCYANMWSDAHLNRSGKMNNTREPRVMHGTRARDVNTFEMFKWQMLSKHNEYSILYAYWRCMNKDMQPHCTNPRLEWQTHMTTSCCHVKFRRMKGECGNCWSSSPGTHGSKIFNAVQASISSCQWCSTPRCVAFSRKDQPNLSHVSFS